MEWSPISGGERIDKLLVTVNDVTHLRKMEEKAEEKDHELRIVSEILACDERNWQRFLLASRRYLTESRELCLLTNSTGLRERIQTVFMNIHTIKGSVRSLQLKHLNETLHRVEQSLSGMLKDSHAELQRHEILDQLTEAETALHRYEAVALQKLGRSSQKSRLFTLGSDAVMTIYSVLHKLEQRGAPGPMQVENAAQILRSSLFTGMDELMDDIFAPMPLLARDLGKTPPQVECRLPKLSVTAPAEEALRNIFLHLIRNALDHGIESAEERHAAGKPEKGLLKLSAWSQDDHLGLRFSDDGRGLNLKHLRELAKAQRLLTDDQIASDEAVANLIFLAELSTAETISDISGRGIGMAAARRFIEALQGRIEIELTDARASGFGYRSFVFVMTLPKELFPSADDGVAA